MNDHYTQLSMAVDILLEWADDKLKNIPDGASPEFIVDTFMLAAQTHSIAQIGRSATAAQFRRMADVLDDLETAEAAHKH